MKQELINLSIKEIHALIRSSNLSIKNTSSIFFKVHYATLQRQLGLITQWALNRNKDFPFTFSFDDLAKITPEALEGICTEYNFNYNEPIRAFVPKEISLGEELPFSRIYDTLVKANQTKKLWDSDDTVINKAAFSLGQSAETFRAYLGRISLIDKTNLLLSPNKIHQYPQNELIPALSALCSNFNFDSPFIPPIPPLTKESMLREAKELAEKGNIKFAVLAKNLGYASNGLRQLLRDNYLDNELSNIVEYKPRTQKKKRPREDESESPLLAYNKKQKNISPPRHPALTEESILKEVKKRHRSIPDLAFALGYFPNTLISFLNENSNKNLKKEVTAHIEQNKLPPLPSSNFLPIEEEVAKTMLTINSSGQTETVTLEEKEVAKTMLTMNSSGQTETFMPEKNALTPLPALPHTAFSTF